MKIELTDAEAKALKDLLGNANYYEIGAVLSKTDRDDTQIFEAGQELRHIWDKLRKEDGNETEDKR